MSKKVVLAITLIFVLIGMFRVTPMFRKVKASGTIYIRADGSIEPSDAPISSFDNVTYNFSTNIYDSIVVERDNVIIDGAGYTVQGTGAYPSKGIDLTGRSNVTTKNMEIKAFYYGIYLSGSSGNTISGNNITNNNDRGIYLLMYCSNNSIDGNNINNNDRGIYLQESYNNTISGNIIMANHYGIDLSWSSNNIIYHNDFIDNTQHAHIGTLGYANFWDDGYPPGGNYWSNYTGTDANHDGIGDTAYIIDANNTDHYPLMSPYVIPEFPSFLILPLFMIATLLAVIIYKRKRPTLTRHGKLV